MGVCGARQVAADMGALAAEGINSFKFFMAYKGVFQVDDLQLLRGFQRCKQLGALPQAQLSACPPSPPERAAPNVCVCDHTVRAPYVSVKKMKGTIMGIKMPEPLAC